MGRSVVWPVKKSFFVSPAPDLNWEFFLDWQKWCQVMPSWRQAIKAGQGKMSLLERSSGDLEASAYYPDQSFRAQPPPYLRRLEQTLNNFFRVEYFQIILHCNHANTIAGELVRGQRWKLKLSLNSVVKSLAQELYQAKKKGFEVIAVELAHTHCSLEMLYHGRWGQVPLLSPLSFQDLLWRENLRPHFPELDRFVISCVTKSGRYYFIE